MPPAGRVNSSPPPDPPGGPHAGAPAAPRAEASVVPPDARLAVPLVVGVLSDTHGHLYPRVARLLEGVDHIIHAGDVGSAHVLKALRSLAPVTAVRGNCDVGSWAGALPFRTEVELAGVRIVVEHVARRPQAETGREPLVRVSGHSHLASLEQHGPVLHLNPGSAGPRRFGRPRTIARLEIRAATPDEAGISLRVTAQIVPADDE